MFKMPEMIDYISGEMKKHNLTFNGMQVFDHKRVLELCAVVTTDTGSGVCYAKIRTDNPGWFGGADEPIFKGMVGDAIKRFEEMRQTGKFDDNTYLDDRAEEKV